jgi:hypothetical protein
MADVKPQGPDRSATTQWLESISRGMTRRRAPSSIEGWDIISGECLRGEEGYFTCDLPCYGLC